MIKQIDYRIIAVRNGFDKQGTRMQAGNPPSCNPKDSCEDGKLYNLAPAYTKWDWQPSRAGYNAGVCIMLSFLLSLLLGAMFATGRNPFAAFDFSTPRFSRGRLYQMRMQSKMDQSQAMASAAFQLSGAQTAVKGVVGKGLDKIGLGSLGKAYGATGKARKGAPPEQKKEGEVASGTGAGATQGQGAGAQGAGSAQGAVAQERVNLAERIPVLAPFAGAYSLGKGAYSLFKKKKEEAKKGLQAGVGAGTGTGAQVTPPGAAGTQLPGATSNPTGAATTPNPNASPAANAPISSTFGAMNQWMAGMQGAEGQKMMLGAAAAGFAWLKGDKEAARQFLNTATTLPASPKTKQVWWNLLDRASAPLMDQFAQWLAGGIAGRSYSGIGYGLAYAGTSIATAPLDRQMFELIRDIIKTRGILKRLDQDIKTINERVGQAQTQADAEAIIDGKQKGKDGKELPTVANTIDIQFIRLERIVAPEIEWLSKRLGISPQQINELSREMDVNAIMDSLQGMGLDRQRAAIMATVLVLNGLVIANKTDLEGKMYDSPSQAIRANMELLGWNINDAKLALSTEGLLGVSRSLLNLEIDYAFLTIGQYKTASSDQLQSLLEKLKGDQDAQRLLNIITSNSDVPSLAQLNLTLGLKTDATLSETITALRNTKDISISPPGISNLTQEQLNQTLGYYELTLALSKKNKELEKALTSYNSARSLDFTSFQLSNLASRQGPMEMMEKDYRMGLEATMNIKKTMFDAFLIKNNLKPTELEQQDSLRRQQEMEAREKDSQVDDKKAIAYLSEALSLIEKKSQLITENKEIMQNTAHRDLSVNPSMFESQEFANLVENYQKEGHPITLVSLLESDAISLTSSIGNNEALEASRALTNYLGLLEAQKEKAQEIQKTQSPGMIIETGRRIKAILPGVEYTPTGQVSVITEGSNELATFLSMYYDGKLKGGAIKETETVPATAGTPAVPSTYDFTSLFDVIKSLPQIPTTRDALQSLQTTLERYTTGEASAAELNKAINENALFGATKKALTKLDLWDNIDLKNPQDQYTFAQSAVIIARFGEPVGTQTLSLISNEKDGQLTIDESNS